MSTYNRVKKHRQLKRSAVEESVVSSNESGIVEPYPNMPIENPDSSTCVFFKDDVDDHLTDSSFENTNQSPNYDECPMSSLSLEESSNSDEASCQGADSQNINAIVTTFRDRLQGWAVKFRNNLTVEAIDGLLEVLRTDHFYSLPKSSVGLLKTKSNENIKIMISSKNTNCSYVYFGVEESLKEIITDEYLDDSIRLLFNVDGLPLFNNSNEQFWPILGLIIHSEYESKPFIVSVYSGDAKPKSVNEFFEDFVEEIKILVQNGVTIETRIFKVDIIGFTCDTPARSFLKQCKGHGGFYACERCEIKGKTKNKRRVYPSVNSKRRTKKSFIKQRQAEHHLGEKSPLLSIPHFDPVKSVFLDSMHLLYLGVMKWILHKLLGTKRVDRRCKISRPKKILLNSTLKIFTKFVPKEFQRKKFELDALSNWKATQFRFFLHYCGALVLRKCLSKNMYHHFLLLVVACRILCDPELCTTKVNYARELLKKFFELLPSCYGTDSQVMNNHNLIHLADDVEHSKINLSEISAFPFENCLGKIKRQIVGKNNPLAQLIRRMSEQKMCPLTAKKNAIHKKNYLTVNPDILHTNKNNVKSFILNGVKLSNFRPNNVVLLKSGDIFNIFRIKKKQESICLYGFTFSTISDVFKYPCNSSEVGIMKLGKLSRRKKIIPLENVHKKCVFFENGHSSFVVTFLHSL